LKTRTGFGVALKAQHDLWGSVPSRSDVLGHVPCVLLWVHGETSGQSEVANFELAIGIHKQVARFQVAMEDVCGMDVLQATQDLVDERLEVCICERLTRPDDGGQIAFHELCYYVSAVLRVWRKRPYLRRGSTH
jgi:hypothetical protein